MWLKTLKTPWKCIKAIKYFWRFCPGFVGTGQILLWWVHVRCGYDATSVKNTDEWNTVSPEKSVTLFLKIYQNHKINFGIFSIAQILLILGLNTCEFYVNSLTLVLVFSEIVGVTLFRDILYISKEIKALRVGPIPQKCYASNHGITPKVELMFQ